MRRKKKIRWYVQDWRGGESLWWTCGAWMSMESRPPKRNASSMKSCRNKSNAIKNARKIKNLGGSPLISSRTKRSWQDWSLSEKGSEINAKTW